MNINASRYGLLVITGMICLLTGSAAGYMVGSRKTQQATQSTVFVSPSPVIQTLPSPSPGEYTGGLYDGWKVYRDSLYEFSFSYPPSTDIISAPQEASISGIPQALETLTLKVPIEGMISINVYEKQPVTILNKDFPFTEPCGSQYGTTDYGTIPTNDVLTLNGITLLHRRTFHDRYDDSMRGVAYGSRVDYCFVSGSGNLVIFRGVNGTLSFRNSYRQDDYLIMLLSSLDLGNTSDN